jgi:hypothetical protein
MSNAEGWILSNRSKRFESGTVTHNPTVTGMHREGLRSFPIFIMCNADIHTEPIEI